MGFADGLGHESAPFLFAPDMIESSGLYITAEDKPMENQKITKEYKRRLLWRFLKGSKGMFALSMLCSALAALADMVSPQIIRVAVDRVLGGRETVLPGFAERLAERAGGFR